MRCPVCLRRRRAAAVVASLLLIWLSGACQTREATQTEQPKPATLPAWIDRVYPPPGGEGDVSQGVQVEHNLAPTEAEGFRLIIDGVDVTTYALASAGLISYDADQERAPVELDPGTHRARVEHVALAEFGETHEVLEAFEWSFDVFGPAPDAG